MKLTICTPTYNRAYCLDELYMSLCRQTCKNFEWIIVDDGSTDNTKQLVEGFNAESFPLKYIFKENGGKHTAVNKGIEAAEGEFFMIVDSDDILTEDAVDSIISGFIGIPESFAGISFNRSFKNGKLIGSTFAGEYVDCTSLERPKFNIYGDKAECFFTEILRKYPFPVFEGERFLGEAVVWNRIAASGHKIRWYNKAVYLCEYRSDGLSMNASGLKNFEGYTLSVKELLSYPQAALKEKIRNLGVYAYTARNKPATDREIADFVHTSVVWVKLSRWLYTLKRKLSNSTREKELNIK